MTRARILVGDCRARMAELAAARIRYTLGPLFAHLVTLDG